MTEIAAALDALLAPFDRSDAPGLALGVRYQGSVIYRRGVGLASLEARTTITPSTRMRIASVTKHMTALVALQLARERLFDLDRPIRDYVCELSGPGGDPTIRQLLQHRGGSRCYLDLAPLTHGVSVPPLGAALAAQVRQVGRNFAPGDAMMYNNGGYHLVSIAISRLVGRPFEEVLTARLFAPVGMVDTASIPSDYVITPGIATMHVGLGEGRWRRGLFASEEFLGEGAVVSTIDDMLRWTEHLSNLRRSNFKGLWRELTERRTFADGRLGTYALGLIVGEYRGATIVHHSGGLAGAASQMLIFPDHDLEIVAITNGVTSLSPITLSEQVADLVLGDALGDRQAATAALYYTHWMGDWWSPETGMVYRLIDEDGELKLIISGYPHGFRVKTQGGQLVCSSGQLDEILLDLGSEASNEDLAITFGGKTSLYHRAIVTADEVETFAAAAEGSYYAADADCTVTIGGPPEAVVAIFSDAYGQVRANLTCIASGVAVTTACQPTSIHAAALSFDQRGHHMARFKFNSMRTRDLIFKRRGAALKGEQ